VEDSTSRSRLRAGEERRGEEREVKDGKEGKEAFYLFLGVA
jgi:hypothetical protein